MVNCVFWTPTGRLDFSVLPQTRELAQRVKTWPFVKKVIWLGQAPSWWQQEVHQAQWSDRAGWLRSLLELGKQEEHLFLVPADAPLLRQDLCTQLWEMHQQQKADYTFADCFPLGLSGEFVRNFALQAMVNLPQESSLPDRMGIFSCILNQVNAFDVETLLSPIDLRAYRVNFFDQSLRDQLLIRRFLERSQLPLNEFLQQVQTDRLSQRTLPAFWKMQWTNAVLSVPIYSSHELYGQQVLQANPEKVEQALRRVGQWLGQAVLMPGFWGEVSQYPHLVRATQVAVEAGFEVVFETSALGWEPGVLEKLTLWANKLTWIVEADALELEAYRRLRGEGFEQMMQTAKLLQQLFPNKVYLQAVRCTETEDSIEAFYKKAEELGFHPLIMGYNDLAGRLPQRRTVDLSPWKRNPCWHLQRGLHSLADGRVISCHQFPQGEVVWGNLFEEDVEAIWERGRDWMLLHQNQQYPKECANCHEYFQFVF